MRYFILALLLCSAFCYCNDDHNAGLEATEDKLDEAGKKLQNSLETVADSVESKTTRWRDSTDAQNDRRDSTNE